MGAKQSSNNNNDESTSSPASGQGSRRTFSGVSPAGSGPGATASFTVLRAPSSGNGAESAVSARQRARSLISVPNGHQPIVIPSSSASSGYSNAASGSPGTDSSTPEDSASGISQMYGRGDRVFAVNSLPAQLLSFNGKQEQGCLFRCHLKVNRILEFPSKSMERNPVTSSFRSLSSK